MARDRQAALVRALVTSDRFAVLADGRLHRPRSAQATADLLATFKGRGLRWRRRGFPETHGRFAAIVKPRNRAPRKPIHAR